MSFQFHHFCPQLFFRKKGSSEPPEPLATAILVNLGEYFLITANHVFDKREIDEIFIFIDSDQTVQLYGEIGFYMPVAGYDYIDIAVLRLDERLVKKLSQRFQFLHFKNIAFTGVPNDINEFVFFGFIAHQTELKGNMIESEQFAMVTNRKKIPVNSPSGYNDQEHIWLIYNRGKQSFIDSNSTNIGPRDLTGLSGGGVWALVQRPTLNRPAVLQLAGIMIEERIKKGYIVASKIHMLIGILSQKFGLNPASYIH
jgi:hypothetical protein